MDIICSDAETLVDTDKGTVPFEIKFGMILSMFLGCGNQEPLGQPESDCWIGTCFPAGTQITMADGSEKSIEDVKVGEYVMSYDVDTGAYVPRQVLVFDDEPKVGDHAAANAELGNPPSLYTINDGLIEFTPEHPFYVKEDGETKWAALVPNDCQHPQKGSKDELSLEVGQEILLDGEWVRIESIGVSRYDVPEERVYNLMIDDTQTYIADGVVVHNKCFPPGTKVTMADGSVMNIEDVSIGDRVMTFEEATGAYEPGIVTNIETPIDDHLYVINDGLIETTRDHPFYAAKPDGTIVWAAIDKQATLEKMPYLYFVEELEVGDSVMDESGQWIAIESMDLKQGAFQVYNLLGITENPNFFANGLLVHNRNGGTPGTGGGGGGAGGGAG
jgi:intein/homing endonuclease